ncbi:Tigger transposable element-derived protein 4-like [Oopsacas minuta]|uniref:Tigger transposable element-derived protein 4-like n=1 Tax=Oopsacas minuta TaxID=111878 RepID=A0AAV7JGX2_9METZ|nr:Tigger transposable element-derived protein 4-like [Oopsacas minuta]
MSRCLKKLDYSKPYPTPAPMLSEKNRLYRIQWARNNIDNQWQHAIFADEPTIWLSRANSDVDQKSTTPDESVTGPSLLEKSICFAEKLKVRNVSGHLEPVFLDLNWIDRWKKRNNITSRQISGGSQSTDHAGADNWISTQLKLIREVFEDKDIFIADETGLFWKMTPDRTLSF